jgi:hypothetical protein
VKEKHILHNTTNVNIEEIEYAKSKLKIFARGRNGENR